MECYKDTLPSDTKIASEDSERVFRFGPSKVYPSTKKVTLPVNIANTDTEIVVDIVDCEIPMLLSKEFLKSARSNLDFVSDRINMFGETVQL